MFSALPLAIDGCIAKPQEKRHNSVPEQREADQGTEPKPSLHDLPPPSLTIGYHEGELESISSPFNISSISRNGSRLPLPIAYRVDGRVIF